MAPPAVNAPHRVIPDLDTLVGLFYDSLEPVGVFEEVQPLEMPPVFRGLLAHEHHMTVTVEAHHQSRVDVRVLDRRVTPTHYAREILLARQSDGRVVQYGIMRVNFSYLGDAVRRRIESEQTPLGRILIEHDVLRRVHLFSLWKVAPGERLRETLELDAPTPVYGRTALIYCNEEPAIELLEIVRE